MNPNPFSFGNPIRDPRRFIGREEEIQQITSRLLSSARESTSVVGERRIGKTSLLKHLENPEVAEGFGLGRDQFCLVYIDFQGLTDITPLRFWQRVLRKIGRSLCDDALAPMIEETRRRDEIDVFDLEDLFEEISDSGINVVLLLDEFEYVTQNPNFGSDFFGGLRALAIHFNLSLVPATRRELVDLCHSEEIKGSPFFNIFATIVLRPFSLQDARQLLRCYTAEREHPFSPDEIDFVLGLASGYPFFTQMAGMYLYQGKEGGLRGQDLYESVLQNFHEQTDQHFTYFWSHSSDSEKITLLAIMAINSSKPKDGRSATRENIKGLHPRADLDINELLKRGLLVEQEGRYSLFSPVFQQWISYEISAVPGQEEKVDSVEQWLKDTGDDQLNPVKGALPRFKKKYWPAVGSVLKDLSIEIIQKVSVEMILSGMR
jgi:AAA+ ATPase superfamily predicted ATPase